MQRRARQHSGDLWFEVREVSVSGVDELFEIGAACTDEDVLKVVAKSHASAVVMCYTNPERADLALRHAIAAKEHADVLDDADLNNIGYVLLANGMCKEAIDVFGIVLSRNERYVLTLYNCAVAHFQNGTKDSAVKLFEEVISQERKNPFFGTGGCFCSLQ